MLRHLVKAKSRQKSKSKKEGEVMLNLIKAMLEKIRKTRAKSNCLHYISMGQNILPDKLSVTEEQKLAKELAAGNLSAKQELIEHNLRLVVFTAQKRNFRQCIGHRRNVFVCKSSVPPGTGLLIFCITEKGETP